MVFQIVAFCIISRSIHCHRFSMHSPWNPINRHRPIDDVNEHTLPTAKNCSSAVVPHSSRCHRFPQPWAFLPSRLMAFTGHNRSTGQRSSQKGPRRLKRSRERCCSFGAYIPRCDHVRKKWSVCHGRSRPARSATRGAPHATRQILAVFKLALAAATG